MLCEQVSSILCASSLWAVQPPTTGPDNVESDVWSIQSSKFEISINGQARMSAAVLTKIVSAI
eukprot:1997357-Pleurochrysis_carterae.AAC.1